MVTRAASSYGQSGSGNPVYVKSKFAGAGPFTLPDSASVFIVDATVGDQVLTLPSASLWGGGFTGRLLIRRTDATASTVTLQRADQDTINGGVLITIPPASETELIVDGTTAWLSRPTSGGSGGGGGSRLVVATDYGADGVGDDNTPFVNWTAALGVGLIENNVYSAPGVPGSAGVPADARMFFADDATIEGKKLPYLSISHYGVKQQAVSHVFVAQDTRNRTDPYTVQIHRLLESDPFVDGVREAGIALRGYTKVNVHTLSTEIAISGELDSFSNSTSLGNTAVSGVATKSGTAVVFGGHFISWDKNEYATPDDVTPVVGTEMGIRAHGLDHPDGAGGVGYRYVLDVIPRPHLEGLPTATEVGCGIRIRPQTNKKAHFRIGLIVDDTQRGVNPFPTTTGIVVRTEGPDGVKITGENTAAHLRLQSFDTTLPYTTPYGLVIQGNYGFAGIRLDTGVALAMSDDSAIKFRYNAGTAAIEYLDGADERFAMVFTAVPTLQLNNTQVLTTRRPGWTAPTGAFSRASFATGTVTLPDLAQRVKALIDDLTIHGLIGA